MTFAPGDAHDICIYGGRFRVVFPILDADGDMVVGAAGMASQCSIDQGDLGDCVNETLEIPGSGLYYLDLVRAETLGSNITIIVSSDTLGAKTTILSIPIIRSPVMESGTARTGSTSSTIALAITASTKTNFYNGLYVQITSDSPTNALGQTRKIIAYDGTTQTATIDALWGTVPTSTSPYNILFAASANAAANDLSEIIWTRAGSDPIGVPPANASLGTKLDWLTAFFRNKKTVDRVTGDVTLRNDTDTGTISTTTATDDGTVFTRPKVT